MKNFFLTQVNYFKLSKSYYILLLFLGLFNLIFFKILKIFFNININFIDGARIGHFVIQGCIFVQLIKKKKSKYLFFVNNVSNDFLLKVLKKKLNITNNFIIMSILIAKEMFKYLGLNIQLSDICLPKSRKFEKWNNIKENVIGFSKKEKLYAKKILKEKFNISSRDKYVCLISRDHAYLRDKNSEHSFRNFNIDLFNLASKELIKLGYKVIRMGKKVDRKISFKNINYIDYANSIERSDLLDFYLIKNCSFMISNVTGLDNIAQIYKKPICFIVLSLNYIYPYRNQNIILPRIFIDRKNKFLPLSQIIKNKLTATNKTSVYKKLKTIPLNPRPQDIKMLAREMHLKINGKLKFNHEKQKKYWKIFFKYSDKKNLHIIELNKKFKPQISNYFLKQNSKWFLK